MEDIERPKRAPRGTWQALPWALRIATAYAACLVVVATGLYLLAMALARVAPLTLATIAALLLAALVEPVAAGARRLGSPRWLAALAAVLVVLLVLALPPILGWTEVQDPFRDLGGTLGKGLVTISDWFVNGPLRLDQAQVDAVREDVARMLPSTAADLVNGAATAFEVLAAGLFTMLLLFFLVKDGPSMWRWLVQRLPEHRRARIDDAGRAGWHVLGRYTRGMFVVAGIDAVSIGLTLVLVDVPLLAPLILVTFIGGFIPYFGATMAGVAAVLVTLVSNGTTDALIILAAVVTVQTLDGYLLEPLIVGRAVALHPAAVLLAVAAGGLVAGVGGAVVAVPLLAVAYGVGVRLARPSDGQTHRSAPPGDGG